MTPTAHQTRPRLPGPAARGMDAGHRAARLTSHQREPGRRAEPCGRALASELALPGVGGGARELSMPARRRGPEPARAGLVHGIGCTAGDYAQPQRRRHLASTEHLQPAGPGSGPASWAG